MGDGRRKKAAALIEEENEWLFLKKADNCSAWLEDTIYKGWRMPSSEASSWSVHNILAPDWSEGSQGGVKMFPWLMIVMSQVLVT